MIWFVDNLERGRLEREALEALASECAWLRPGEWRFDDAFRLVWDADIVVGDRVFPVTLQYPNHFPHSPPLVLPRRVSERWSPHQYGPGGELCLEFGPDNWQPTITGADMMRSAQRLFQGERPETGVHGVVASRHATTLGQDLRGLRSRLFVTREAGAIFACMPENTVLTGTMLGFLHDESCMNVVASIVLPDGSSWIDRSVPKPMEIEGFPRAAALIRWPKDADLPQTASLGRFNSDIAGLGIVLPPATVVVIVKGETVQAYGLLPDNDKVYAFGVVQAPAPAARLDQQHQILNARKVAIVGCGSVGSKIAVMLARSGVGAFLLVDDDLMLPDNLVRHDLDWRDIATHKADSVARRIWLVNAKAACEVRLHRLGGQEASGSVETLIGSVAQCDLLIDATADPRVFNYLCAASASGRKPMVWAEVFGGGVGGLIARYRPDFEPEPALIRGIIDNWFSERSVQSERPGDGYEGREAGVLMIADDADVSVIAAHAARLAIDTLIERETSAFPHSAYVIGLGRGLCFDQPFDTFPIEVGHPQAGTMETGLDEQTRDEEMARVRDLLKKRINAAGRPAGSA